MCINTRKLKGLDSRKITSLPVLLLFQDCKSSQTKNTKLSRQISHKNLDKSRVKFRSRVRVQQQRHMTETRNNYQDVHDVTQLEMSLTARDQKSDSHGTLFQSSPKINRMLITRTISIQ